MNVFIPALQALEAVIYYIPIKREVDLIFKESSHAWSALANRANGIEDDF